MTKGKYILVNDSFIQGSEYRLTLEETEAIHFFEKFRSVRTVFPFFRQTFDLIRLKFVLLNQPATPLLDDDGALLKRQLERTLTKNKHFMGAIVTVTFRFTGNKLNYSVQSSATEDTDFNLNEKGIYVEIFDKIQKPASLLGTLSLGSSIYWAIAESYRGNADEIFIPGTSNTVLETPGSNVYLIKNKQITGIPEQQGAYTDITKSFMLDIFKEMNLDYSEDEAVSAETIRNADEIMLVNALNGIRWVIGFEGKRYFNNTIRKINEQFNKRLLN